jgi:hypothetical protein
MGHVKRDLGKKPLQNDTDYAYTTEGISNLLASIETVRYESESSDDSVALLVDVMRVAGTSGVLTAHQRCAIFLRYSVGLKVQEAALLLCVDPSNLSKSLRSAAMRIASNLRAVFRHPTSQAEASDVAVPFAPLRPVATGAINPLSEPDVSMLAAINASLPQPADNVVDLAPVAYRYTFYNATLDYRQATLAEYPFYSSQFVMDEAGRFRYAIPPESVMERKQKNTVHTAKPETRVAKSKRSQKRAGRGETKGCDEDTFYGERSRRNAFGFEFSSDFKVRLPSDGDVRRIGDQWQLEVGWNYGAGKTKKIS